MGNRLNDNGGEKDWYLIDICQGLILSCIPGCKTIRFSDPKERSIFFDALTTEQINAAFSSQKMENHIYLEILQRCNIAYNDPILLPFIQSLLHDKTFFSLSKKGDMKRYLTKKLIDKVLKKHLLQVVPKEFRFLITDQYFLQYINELFLPLEKNRIIITIEKFFELSLYEKNSLYNKFDINYQEYEIARSWISKCRNRYKDTLEKYKNDPEYQTIEKIQSIQMEIKNNRLQKVDDDKTFDHTVDDFYAE